MAGGLYVDQAKLTIPKVTIYLGTYSTRYTYICIGTRSRRVILLDGPRQLTFKAVR